MQILAQMGVNFDCASIGEMERVFQLGVTADRIIFANPVRTKEQILQCKTRGVKKMTFDSELEADKVAELYPEAELVLRILPTYSNAHVRLDRYGSGAHQQKDLIAYCRKLNLNIVGVAFHVGSKCNDTESYSKVLKEARTCFNYLKDHGYEPYFLDIGAGFYGTTFEKPTFEDAAEVIKTSLTENFGDMMDKLTVIAEPGRFFCSRPFSFALNIIGKKENPTGPGYFYYTNDGLYGIMSFLIQPGEFFADIPMDFYPPERSERAKVSTTIFGPTCDSFDCLAKRVQLQELDVGDWIIMHEMGAYSLPTGTHFNDMPSAKKTYYISKQNAHLLVNQKARLEKAVKKQAQKRKSFKTVSTRKVKFQKRRRLSSRLESTIAHTGHCVA